MKVAVRLVAPVLALALGLVPESARAQEPARFSLSMFHFNVQYVAGGLVGFPDGVSVQPGFQLDEQTVEDLIVTESFEPALDLLLAHPTWKLTLELQGYMVEVMLERHPGIVDKLRELVDEGRVELVSFHWSDQLFLAYSRLSMERSRELLDEVMARAGLTLSPVIFAQEGQFGEGIARFGPEHGQTILGLPKNLFRFQHAADADTAAPLYRLGEADVVLVGRGYDSPDLQVVWSFFDDGERWSTGGADPYFGRDFQLDPEAVAELEQSLVAQEAAGFRIATIGEYALHVRSTGVEVPELPPILDGTWQPGSTQSMFRWMGMSGIWDAVYQSERDNAVVTANVRTSHDLVTAERLLEWGRGEGLVADGELPDGLEECWREALFGQVTDATGINPFIGEVEYGLEHAERARDCALETSTEIATRAGSPFLEVDNDSGTVMRRTERPSEDALPETALLDEADGFAVDAPGREVRVVWETLGGSSGPHRVTITVGAPAAAERTMAVTFPFDLDELRLTPGLVEDEVRAYPLEAFDLEDGRISLPLANGLIGLGEGLWLIEDTRQVHVAATIRSGEANVLFQDETMDAESGTTWAFFLLEGTAEEALAEANRRNVRPTVVVEGPQPEPPPEVEATFRVAGGGCGCRTVGEPDFKLRLGWWTILAILPLAVRPKTRSVRENQPRTSCCQTSPWASNLAKSPSRETHVHPCSSATAACWASDTILPVAFVARHSAEKCAQCSLVGPRGLQLGRSSSASTTARAAGRGVGSA